MNLHSLLLERQAAGRPIRVGVIGAGKFSTMYLSQARRTPGIQVVGIAELNPDKALAACKKVGWPEESMVKADSRAAITAAADKGLTALTGDALELIAAGCEVIIEVTGLPGVGAAHALAAINQGSHLIMPNVETDCLIGPLLRRRAEAAGLVFSMAYGDQPALILDLVDWARASGLSVVCAGKGGRQRPDTFFSTPDTVWDYFGFSPEMVASGGYNAKMYNSFIDGTKSAIEMCAVCNGSGLKPQSNGLNFPPVNTDGLAQALKPQSDGGLLEFEGTVEVAACDLPDGTRLERDIRHGVFITMKAANDYEARCFTELDMQVDDSGRYTALFRPFHYLGLELGYSVASAALLGRPTGTSLDFKADVAAVAKKDLAPGEKLDGEGGYTVFGRLTSAETSQTKDLLPMGLTDGARLVRPVAKGRLVSYADVELDQSLAVVKLRREMEAFYRA